MDAEDRTIGPYRLLQRLGRGGMGVVYRAVHDDGQLVALKTVRLAAESQLSGLRREILALARLRHPGIVRILDEGISEGLPWYAMELLEGRPLQHYAEGLGLRAAGAQGLQRRQAAPGRSEGAPPEWWTHTLDPRGEASVPLQQTRIHPASSEHAVVGRKGGSGPDPGSRSTLMALLRVVRRLCASLAYLHGEGLVHRDLKSDNVLVMPDGMPVLVDFGLAVQYSGELSREVLATAGFAAGTVNTMAPEQIHGELVDARADLYALGCILYELITGRPPFVGEARVEVLWQHLYAAPEPPSMLVPDVPEGLELLILRLLAKSPRDRFGHADDVAAALERLGAEDEGGPGGGATEAAWPKPNAYLYRPGFVGREEALTELERRLQRLSDNSQGALVLVGGESGIGKTRLLLEVALRAVRRRIRVLSGESVPVEAGREGAAAAGSGALQPLRMALQAIADLCRERGAEQTERLLGQGQRCKVLALYEPALRGLPGQDRFPEPAELPAEAARLRLFTALAETFRALAEERPLLLLLDDLQWADELTLGFLAFLARTASSGAQQAKGLFVLGTYRTEELGEALRELLALPGARDLRLERLEERAIGQMICDMLALAENPVVFARYLSRNSEGNPFFVGEYLRVAVGAGILYRDESSRWQLTETSEALATEELFEKLPLPSSLHELVRRRLDSLGVDARQILEVACVLGREVDEALLGAIVRLAEPTLMEAVDELLRRQILEYAGRHLRFVHDQIREVGYMLISGNLRRQLHQAAATALEAKAGADDEKELALLGHHWEQAGSAQKARASYLAGARKARSQYAFGQAERLYRTYLGLVSEPTLESVVARNELAHGILRFLGRASESIEEQQQALDEARMLGERAVEAHCLWTLGVLRHDLGQMHEAEASYNRALAMARELGSRADEALVLNSLGRFHHEQGHLKEAQALYENALSIARELGMRLEEGTSLMHLAVLQQHHGRLAEAEALHEQALAIHRELGARKGEARVLLNLAVVYQVQGRGERACEIYEQALAIHREVGNRRGEGIILGNLAIIHREQGRPQAVRALLQQALAIHREIGSRSFVGIALREIATLERQCYGALEEAEAVMWEAEAISEEIGAPRQRVACLCQRGHLALARNRPAHEFLQQARSLAAMTEPSPKSELGQTVSRLQRAQEAFEAGQHERLFRGELIEELPEGLRRWLVQSGQLQPEHSLLPASGREKHGPPRSS